MYYLNIILIIKNNIKCILSYCIYVHVDEGSKNNVEDNIIVVNVSNRAGLVMGSTYVPARLIIAACGLAGLAMSNMKHSIWFDYNYSISVLCGKAGKQ
ncbi:hypothetical protein [Listeria rocourtiae]|uniref:hypothetical protein n=1 Tax=Listeria rocourtiae TaxID=647910 RepID=UPI003D2F8628